MLISKNGFVTGNMGKFGMSVFFMIHYFGFMLGLGLFIFIGVLPRHGTGIGSLNIPLIFMGIIITYFWQFMNEFIMNGKYKETTAGSLFFSPYPRVFIMAIIILAGGKLSNMLGTHLSYTYLIILTVLKFISDVVYFYVTSNLIKAKGLEWF